MAHALRSRLNPSFRDVLQMRQFLTRYTSNLESQYRCFADRETLDEEEFSRPLKYTTSKANFESAEAARRAATRDDSPWSQTISLMLSLAIFLVYFGYWRESNDVDELIYRDISVTVPAFKEVHNKLQTRDGREAVRKSVQGSL